MGVTRRAAAIAITALALTACAKKDDTAGDTTSATRANNTTPASDARSALPGSAGASGLSDANIFAMLDGANAADSGEGAIAAAKGTSAQVREFGKQMMRDHHMMRVEGQTLAKKLNVIPQPASDDNSQAELQKSTDLLNNTAKGKDFDRAYVDLQVEYHKAVLDKTTKAMAATQTAELKNLIQKAAPKVLAHLDKVEAIQKGMR